MIVMMMARMGVGVVRVLVVVHVRMMFGRGVFLLGAFNLCEVRSDEPHHEGGHAG